MSTIEINYESEHEFLPVPSIYIDMPDCDEAVANEIVAHVLRDVTQWENPGGMAMCLALEASEVSKHSTLSITHDETPALTVNVLRRTVTVPLFNRPKDNGAILTYSAFILLVEAGIAVDATTIARALAKEANGGS